MYACFCPKGYISISYHFSPLFLSFFPILPSILNLFALFLLPNTNLSFSAPCPDIRLLTVCAISVVYPFLAFLASFISTSLSFMHCCFIALSSQLALDGFLLHLKIRSRWGLSFSASSTALELGSPTVLGHFLCCPLLLQFLFLSLYFYSLVPLLFQSMLEETL